MVQKDATQKVIPILRVESLEQMRALPLGNIKAVLGNVTYTRHKNLDPEGKNIDLDGTKYTYGGFVASAARVSKDSLIGAEVVIFNGTTITSSTLKGRSQAYQGATVIDSEVENTIISFDAYVTGSRLKATRVGSDEMRVDVWYENNKFKGYLKGREHAISDDPLERLMRQ